MGTPLHGEALLRYVRARLHELDETEERMPAAWQGVDRESPAYQLGRLTGLAAGYHDVEHAMQGWYGGIWEQDTA